MCRLGDGHDEAQVGLDELTFGLHVATLDASRQRDLLLGGEQRDLAHLAEVHAHGIAGGRLDREVELDGALVLARRLRFRRLPLTVEDVDPEIGEDDVDLLDLFHAEIQISKGSGDLGCLQISLLAALVEQGQDLVQAQHAEIAVRGAVVRLCHTLLLHG